MTTEDRKQLIIRSHNEKREKKNKTPIHSAVVMETSFLLGPISKVPRLYRAIDLALAVDSNLFLYLMT